MKKKRSSKNTLPFRARVSAPVEDIDLALLRRQIKNRVGQEALPMVESTIDAVKNGQYAALKYLFEAVGLFPAENPEQDRQQDALAPTLLQALGLPELPNAERTVTKDSEQE
jgi:hypothetical protein